MAHIDLITGETYDHIIYIDDLSVIFATTWGESAISRDEFDAKVLIDDETSISEDQNQTAARIAVDRFQTTGVNELVPLRVTERRDTLNAYAASNQGRIDVHFPEERKTRFSRLARWGRGLFE